MGDVWRMKWKKKLEWYSCPNWNHSFNNFHYKPRTISSTSVSAGRHLLNFYTHQLPSEVETRWSLNRCDRVHTLRCCEFLKLLYFRSCVYEAPFPLGCDAMFLIFRTNQWSGNVGRIFCTDAASRFRRTEYFSICLKVDECWCLVNRTVPDLLICHCSSAVTVKGHDNSWSVYTRFGTGW